MPQATLSGVTLQAHVPLAWEPLSETPDAAAVEALNREAIDLLAVVLDWHEARRSDKQDETAACAAELARLEGKLNLLMGLVGELVRQGQGSPKARRVEVNAQGVCWDSPDQMEPGAHGLVSVYLLTEIPKPLELPVRVVAVERRGQVWRVCGHFIHLDPVVTDALERLVFRQHRRSVARKRRPDAGS